MPQSRLLTFTENFTDKTGQSDATTASWGDTPGKLTMKPLPRSDSFRFEYRRIAATGSYNSADRSAEYSGQSEYFYSRRYSKGFLILRPSGANKQADGSRSQTRFVTPGQASSHFVDDYVLFDFTGDGVEEFIEVQPTGDGKAFITVQANGTPLSTFDHNDETGVSERMLFGDFSGDGMVDMVRIGRKLTLLKQKPRTFSLPTFETGSEVGRLRNPDENPVTAAAVGDLDNDGRPDIVVEGQVTSAASETSLRIYLANPKSATGFDASSITLPVANKQVKSLQVIELDGEAGNEILVNFVDGELWSVSRVQESLYKGGIPVETADSESFVGAAAGDMNGDGIADLAYVDQTGQVWIRWGTLGRTFWQGGGKMNLSRNLEGPTPASVSIRDVDNDGLADVSVIRAGVVENFLFRRESATNAARNHDIRLLPDTETFDANSMVEFADVNQDGRTDVVMCGVSPGGKCYIVLHTGNIVSPYELSKPTAVTLYGKAVSDVSIGDLSGDGFPDLVLSGADLVRIIENTRNSIEPFVEDVPVSSFVSRTITSSPSNPVRATAVGDVTGDGINDLAVGLNTGLRVYVGIGSQLSTTTRLPTGINLVPSTLSTNVPIQDLQVADLDGSGALELVGTAAGTARVWTRQPASSNWTSLATPPQFPANKSGGFLAPIIGDIDGDGRGDMAAVVEAQPPSAAPDLRVAKGQSGDSVPFSAVQAVAAFPSKAVVLKGGRLLDFNNDGKNDFVATAFVDGKITMYGAVNASTNGSISFSSLTAFGAVEVGGDAPLSAHPVEINPDGVIDLLVLQENSFDFHLSTMKRILVAHEPVEAKANLKARDIEGIEFSRLDADERRDLVGFSTDGIKSGLPVGLMFGEPKPGEFAESVGITQESLGIKGIAVGRLDRDDLDDLVVMRNGGFTTHLSTSAAKLADAAGTIYLGQGVVINAAAIGKLSADGFGDVVLATERTADTTTPMNAGAEPYVFRLQGERVSVIDINHNGTPEVVILNNRKIDIYTVRTVSPIIASKPDKSIELPAGDGSVNWLSTNLIVDDVNRDGNVDVVASTGAGSTVFVPGPLLEAGDVPSTANFSNSSNYFVMELVDFDGNGLKDLLVSENGFSPTQVLINSGDFAAPFSFRRATTKSFTEMNASAAAVRDISGDMIDDVVVSKFARFTDGTGFLKSYVSAIQPMYGTHENLAQSKSLTVPDDNNFIERATLTATASTSVKGTLAFQMTNNGTNWYSVESGKQFVFPTSGKALAWRAALRSSDGLTTASVSRVAIEAHAFVPPAAVVNATAEAGDRALLVKWQPGPVASGGIVKTYKVVNAKTNETLCTTIASPCLVSGLTNATEYALRVIAENPAGAVVTNVVGQLTPTPLPEKLDKPVVVGGDGVLNVSWEPKFNKATHAPVLRYVAKVVGRTESCESTTTSCTIKGLANGLTYSVQVAAVNLRGQGEFSAFSDTARTVGLPTINSALVSEVKVGPSPGGFRVNVPADLFSTSGLALRDLKLLVNGTEVCSTSKATQSQAWCQASSELFLLTGLSASAKFVDDTEYEFTLVAVNEAGDSDPSPAVKAKYLGSIATFEKPTVSVGDGELTVEWKVPPNGGSDFTVSVAAPKQCVASGSSVTKCVISGLTNGTLVTLNYRASNGFSEVFGSVSGVPAPKPGKPTNVGFSTTSDSLVVEWTPSENVVEARVSGYSVTLNPGNKTSTLMGPSDKYSVTFDGFKKGDKFTASVVAIGAAGESEPVPFSGTIAVEPGRVTDVEWTPSARSIEVSWKAPADDGGDGITGYAIKLDGRDEVSTTSTSYTVSSLSPGESINAVIYAVNASGKIGEGYAVSLTAMDKPGKPLIRGVRHQTSEFVVLTVEPTSSGGGDVIIYDCRVRRGLAPEVVEPACGLPNGDVVVSRGELKPGEKMSVTVSARNELRKGDASDAVDVTIASAPGGISSVETTTSVDGLRFDIAFSAADDGGSPISSYELVVVDLGTNMPLQTLTTDPTNRRFTFEPPLGVSVNVGLRAVNDVGSGPTNVLYNKLLVFGPPSAPRITKVLPGDREIYVEWDVPLSTGGAMIEGYSIEAVAESASVFPDSIEITEGFRGAVFSNLRNGVKYRIVVSAYTEGGIGSAESEEVLPSGPPSPPVVFVDGVGDGFADVSWTEPADTGGLPIIEYVVTTTPEGGKCEIGPKGCRVTGLTNGVGYVVSVATRTEWGTGMPSISRSFTPLPADLPAQDVANLSPPGSPERVKLEGPVNPGARDNGTVGGSDAQSTSAGSAASTGTVSSTPRLVVGQKVALRALVAAFKVKLPKGAVALLDVKAAATTPCSVTKRFVKARSVGRCAFTILVQPKKGKPKRVAFSVEVVSR